MPPKVKVTREHIIATAMEIVRQSGAQALNARTVAAALECSTQPVFSNFESMEMLKQAVGEQAEALCQEYIRREIEQGQYPEYKASGMAYIRFAKEEKELFKLLYMRDRANETIPTEIEFGSWMEHIATRHGLAGDRCKAVSPGNVGLCPWNCHHVCNRLFRFGLGACQRYADGLLPGYKVEKKP